VLLILYSSISKVAGLPYTLRLLLDLAEPMSYWALIILVLLPTSITMSLVWKIKEAILASVFGQEH
jgi:hypothetical protein